MRVLLTLMLLLAAPLAFAADPLSIPAITLGTNAAGAQEYSVSLQILLIMTALSFIPAFVMLMTSFTRIIIVFSILRQALGLQQTPSNQILTGMALFLTLFIMAPVFDKVNQQALQPYLAEKLTARFILSKSLPVHLHRTMDVVTTSYYLKQSPSSRASPAEWLHF
jgi:flagellar biosynthetic protein FliP